MFYHILCCKYIVLLLDDIYQSHLKRTFAGHQLGPQPEQGLCIVQSGMIYAAPVL